MTESPQSTPPTDSLGALRIRDLRRRRSLTPGGAGFGDVVRTFLPLVHESASRHLPGRAESAEQVVVAVFQAFALRWKSIPKRSPVATWLLRAACVAARRERQRLGLPAPAMTSAEGIDLALFQALLRLPSARFEALVLSGILRLPAADTAQALRCRQTRITKRMNQGLERLGKALRKRGVTADPRGWLEGMIGPPPLELEARVLSQLQERTPRANQPELLRAVLQSWQWIRLARLVRRALAVCGLLVLFLIGSLLTFVWLAQHGYLTTWFITHSNRGLAKEMPEITQPARPWPEPAAAAALAGVSPPKNAAELYGLTNIWVAKLSFTAQQWQGIAPKHVPPVRNMQGPNGVIVLRNPNASRNGLAGVLGIDFNWVEAQLDFAGRTFPSVGARYRGNGTYVNSLYGPKQSFKVDLNRFRKGQSLAGVHTLNFVNAIPDSSYLHDALAEQLFRDLGVPGPRTAYAYLTLDVPGRFANQPLGLYVLIENIDGDYAADRFGSKTVPIFKPVTPELFKDLGDDWQAYAGIYDLKTKATPEQLQRVIQFARLVTSADDAEFAARLADFLDLEEFAGFLAGHVLLSSYDGFLSNGQNFYVYLDPRTNQFGFVPWDQDHSWGEFGYVGSANSRERASIWQPSTYPNRFLARVLKVAAFREIYRRRLDEALTRYFTVERLYAQVDHLAAVIRPAVAAESDFRLKRFDAAVSTNWVDRVARGAQEGPKAPVHQVKRFIANRVKSVRDQLDGKAEGVILGRGGRAEAEEPAVKKDPGPAQSPE